MDHLHPESMRQLKKLVRLHGAPAIRKAVKQIEAQLHVENATLSLALSKVPYSGSKSDG